MVFVTRSLNTRRWVCDNNYIPENLTIDEIKNEMNGRGQMFEVLSKKHLYDNRITRIYLDRDCKSKTPFTAKNEQDDYNMCMETLRKAFGNEALWATSTRNGYNAEKNMYCISYHFVCLDIYIDYTSIPILHENKGIDTLFDTAVYKPADQLWGMVNFTKTPNDPRMLIPITYKDDKSAHIIQVLHPDSSKIICIESKKTQLLHKKSISYNINEMYTCADQSKYIYLLNFILKVVCKDNNSVFYKQYKINAYYYKTVRERICVVTPNEVHVSNNFVLFIENNGDIRYRCFSKECKEKRFGKIIANIYKFIQKYDKKMLYV